MPSIDFASGASNSQAASEGEARFFEWELRQDMEDRVQCTEDFRGRE